MSSLVDYYELKKQYPEATEEELAAKSLQRSREQIRELYMKQREAEAKKAAELAQKRREKIEQRKKAEQEKKDQAALEKKLADEIEKKLADEIEKALFKGGNMKFTINL